MLTALLAIAILFVVFLAIKHVVEIEFCALCAAVSGTWIPLLMLYHAGYYANETIIALLIGQSIVGLFYAIKSSIPDRFNVYVLPGLLTATVGGYTVLRPEPLAYPIVVLVVTWALATIAFVYRRDERFRTAFDQLVDCCKDW